MKNWSICSVSIFSNSFRNCLIGFNQVMCGNYNRPYGNFTQPFMCLVCYYAKCKLKFGIKYDVLITHIRRFEIFMKLNFYLHKL